MDDESIMPVGSREGRLADRTGEDHMGSSRDQAPQFAFGSSKSDELSIPGEHDPIPRVPSPHGPAQTSWPERRPGGMGAGETVTRGESPLRCKAPSRTPPREPAGESASKEVLDGAGLGRGETALVPCGRGERDASGHSIEPLGCTKSGGETATPLPARRARSDGVLEGVGCAESLRCPDPVPTCSFPAGLQVSQDSRRGQLGLDFWRRLRLFLRERRKLLRQEVPLRPSAARPADTPGQYARSWMRSPEALAEYRTYRWPLTSIADVRRLLASKHLRPSVLVLGDVTGSLAEPLETRRGWTVLVVDRQDFAGQGLHYQGDFADVAPLAFWDLIVAFPTCTHIVCADTHCADDKALDGRMFWGVRGFQYCYTLANARAVIVEQPNTWIIAFLPYVYCRYEPAHFHDEHTKTINLFFRGCELPPTFTRSSGDWSRLPLDTFADGDAAGNWRSSWALFRNMSAALAEGIRITGDAVPLDPFVEARSFARQWQALGLSVPRGWESATGEPDTVGEREYQVVRGRGDGRRVEHCPVSIEGGQSSEERDAAVECRLGERPLADERLLALQALTTGAVMLFFISTMCQPLIFAALDGFRVIGAQLPASTANTGAPMTLVRKWAQAAGGSMAVGSAYFVGRYKGGPRVAVAPLDYLPPEKFIARTAKQRQTLWRAGVVAAWCTLTALGGTAVAEPAARALVAMDSFRKPVAELADSPALGTGVGLPEFSFGAMKAASLVQIPLIEVGLSPPRWQIMRDEARYADVLVGALLEARGEHAEYLQSCAQLVKPAELADVPEGLLSQLPTFGDTKLRAFPFTAAYVPPVTEWLERRPKQRDAPVGFCPLSARDILLPTSACRGKVDRWMRRMVQFMQCAEQVGADCQYLRPPAIAVGQECQVEQARGLVWDFTFERSECGVPLDFRTPVESNLNVDFLLQELQGYPDQRLISYIAEGVRFEAEVELQAVLVPHLLSLTQGFANVRKEVFRLEAMRWYRFYDAIPFWPIYCNGQGCVPRKLEIGRPRRSTECGGPRKETCDETGLPAWSLNEAAKVYRTPSYFEHLPETAAWYAGQQARDERLREVEPRAPAGKWCRELKPTPVDVARDLAILKAAAEAMGEPVYLFGDDAKDYFNQLVLSPEVWWQFGIVLMAPAEVEDAVDGRPQPKPGQIFFVSERRLGFGGMPASNIAQRFSEALLHIFRRRMDREDQDISDADARPSYAEWRQSRLLVKQPHDSELSAAEWRQAQQRLYFVHMYTDDPFFGVVGVQRALALLRVWRRLTLDTKLIMAIPEKRNLGTSLIWLGVLFLAGLGLVIIPTNKRLRAAVAARQAAQGEQDFATYRSLIGLLEHIRGVTREPRAVMHGLYEPHREEARTGAGPSMEVVPRAFNEAQLKRWVHRLSNVAGASVLAALDKRQIPRTDAVAFVASADAATDSMPAGLGGFCHGYYWYVPVPAWWISWMHITVLELLATGLNAIILARHFDAAERVVLQSDALATPYSLTRHSEKSAILMEAHRELLADEDYCRVAERAEVAHLQGDCNPFADAVSRGDWPRFFELCRVSGIVPQEVKVPPKVYQLLYRVLRAAVRRGVPVRPSTYRPPEPALPIRALALERQPVSKRCLGEARGRQGESPSEVPQPQRMRAGGPDGAPSLLERMLLADFADRQQKISEGSPTAKAATAAASATPNVGVEHASSSGQDGRSSQLERLFLGELSVKRERGELEEKSQAGRPDWLPAVYRIMPSTWLPANYRVVGGGSGVRGKRTKPEVAAAAHRHQAEMAETQVGPLSLPQRPPLPLPESDGLLKAGMRNMATKRAMRMLDSPFTPRGMGLDELTKLLIHASDLADYGAAHGTKKKDECGYRQWVSFCKLIGIDPELDAEQVRNYPDQVSVLMATFMLHVYPKMKGKNGRRWAKPRSAFAYVLTLIRIFKRAKVYLPPASTVRGELQGLLRAFVNVYGKTALQPKRQEPMLFSMVVTMCDADLHGKTLHRGFKWSDSRQICKTFRRMLKVGWRTGHRLAEFVFYPTGEIYYCTRGDLVWLINGQLVTDPSEAQLRSLVPGRDKALLLPPRSKTDQFGEVHAPFPSAIEFHPDKPCNAGRALQEIELEQPCHGAEREIRPLFADENGHPFTHDAMDNLLYAVLLFLFGAGAADTHSWHSLRSGLASALKAAGCSSDDIQLICRWLNPESLRAYARLGMSSFISWVNQAEKSVVDAVQSGNIARYAAHIFTAMDGADNVCDEEAKRHHDAAPKASLCEGFAGLNIEFGRRIGPQAQAMLEQQDEAEILDEEDEDEPEPMPDLSELAAESCVGRRVLVSRDIWPDYECDENKGRGWTAKIVHYSRQTEGATVAFVNATNRAGLPYPDEVLRLDVLQPM